MSPFKQPTSPSPWVDTVAPRRQGKVQARVSRGSRPPPLPDWPQPSAASRRVRSIPPPPVPTLVSRPARASRSQEPVTREPSLSLALRDDDLFQPQERTIVLTESRRARSFPLQSALLLTFSVIVVCMVVARPADARRIAARGRQALMALPLKWEAALDKVQRTSAELGLSASAVNPAGPAVAPEKAPQEREPSPSVDDASLMSIPTEPSPIVMELDAPELLAPETSEPQAEAAPEAEETEDLVVVEPVAENAAAPSARQQATSVRPRRVANIQRGRTGVLRINTRPWAEVYVDGKFIGHTPQTNLELTAGRHRITLKNAEFDLTKDISVRIKPGATSTKVVNLLGAKNS